MPAAAPQPEQGHGAHGRGTQHARLGARQQHEADDPRGARRAPSQRPRTPEQRATTRRKPTTRVRLVPDTAVRWVRPVVRKSSVSSGGIPASSPSTRAGTSARLAPGGGPTASRIEARNASVARQPGPGSAIRTGGPRGVTSAATSPSSAGSEPAGEPHPLPHRHPLPVVVAEDEHGLVAPHGDLGPAPARRNGPGPASGRRDGAGQGDEGALARKLGDRAVAHCRSPARRPPRRPRPPTTTTASPVSSGAPARGPAHGRDEQQRGHDAQQRQGPAGCRRLPARQERTRPRGEPEQGQAQVGPGERRTAAGSSQRHVGRQLGQGGLADAVDVEQLVDGGERAVLAAPGQDRLGGDRADVGQRLERHLVGGVDVDQGGDRRGRPRSSSPPRPAGGATPTRICSPSTSTRARLRSVRSTPARAPPAASSASTTREPASSTAMPGRRTLPATSTVTEPLPGPAEAEGVGRGRSRSPGRPPAAAAAPATSAPPPPSSHQAATPSPASTSSATTASWGGPSVSRPRAAWRPGVGTAAATGRLAAGERLAPRPDPRVGGVVARVEPAPRARGQLGPQQLEPACHGFLVGTASPCSTGHAATLGSRDAARHRPRRACGQPPGATERAPAVASVDCHGVATSERRASSRTERRRGAAARSDTLRSAAEGQISSSGATQTATMPGPTWAPSTAPSSVHQTSRPPRLSASSSASRSASCSARSWLARWATHTSTWRVTGRLEHQRLQTVQGLARGAHLLEVGDLAVGDLEQRLDRQCAAEDRGGRADPAAPAQVLQRVDVEQRRGARGPGPGGLDRLERRPARGERPRRPTARRTRWRRRPAGCRRGAPAPRRPSRPAGRTRRCRSSPRTGGSRRSRSHPRRRRARRPPAARSASAATC